MRGSATGDLHFDNVHVPAENVLIGEGWVPQKLRDERPKPYISRFIPIEIQSLNAWNPGLRNGSLCINERS